MIDFDLIVEEVRDITADNNGISLDDLAVRNKAIAILKVMDNKFLNKARKQPRDNKYEHQDNVHHLIREILIIVSCSVIDWPAPTDQSERQETNKVNLRKLKKPINEVFEEAKNLITESDKLIHSMGGQLISASLRAQKNAFLEQLSLMKNTLEQGVDEALLLSAPKTALFILVSNICGAVKKETGLSITTKAGNNTPVSRICCTALEGVAGLENFNSDSIRTEYGAYCSRMRSRATNGLINRAM